jgi:hypothetical protein
MHDIDDMELGQKQIENLINASCLQMFAHIFDKSLIIVLKQKWDNWE